MSSDAVTLPWGFAVYMIFRIKVPSTLHIGIKQEAVRKDQVKMYISIRTATGPRTAILFYRNTQLRDS